MFVIIGGCPSFCLYLHAHGTDQHHIKHSLVARIPTVAGLRYCRIDIAVIHPHLADTLILSHMIYTNISRILIGAIGLKTYQIGWWTTSGSLELRPAFYVNCELMVQSTLCDDLLLY